MRFAILALSGAALLTTPLAAQFGRGGGGSTWSFLESKYDKNKDGKVTWEEYARDKAKFTSLDTDGDGSISQADFGRSRGRGMRGRRRNPEARVPQRGDAAPDFDLPLAKDTKKTIKLSSFKGKKPVALIFGSYTWPPFVSSAGRLRQLYKDYSKEVEFILVYVREAHAIDSSWPMGRVKVEDPVSDAERQKVASSCITDLKLPMPAVVDGVDDKVGSAYQGHPDRLFLVGKNGKIAYAGARGPMGFRPDELEDAIIEETTSNWEAVRAKKPKAVRIKTSKADKNTKKK